MLQTNEIKRYSAIDQSYCIVRTFDLRQTLPKYIITFWHKNAVLTIGLMDQSDYSIYHLLVRIFIPIVGNNRASNFIQDYLETLFFKETAYGII